MALTHFEAAGLDLVDWINRHLGQFDPQASLPEWSDFEGDGISRQYFEEHRRDYFCFSCNYHSVEMVIKLTRVIQEQFKDPCRITFNPACQEFEIFRTPSTPGSVAGPRR